jgi:hypothetical protein
MPCFKPRPGPTTKNCGEALQRHFDLTKTDTVTDTQRDLPDANPDVVPVQKNTISRFGIEQGYKAIIGQFNTGMEMGYCRMLQFEVAGWIPPDCFAIHSAIHWHRRVL